MSLLRHNFFKTGNGKTERQLFWAQIATWRRQRVLGETVAGRSKDSGGSLE